MSFKLLLIFAAVSATISVGKALKCYACAGTATSDCAQGKISSMAIQPCYNVSHSLFPHTSTHLNDDFDDVETDDDCCRLQAVCLKLYVTDYQPKMLARGCGIFPAKIDPCSFLQKRAHIQGCKSCTTDLCNNQPSEEYDPVVNMMF